ncbi:hypothetical protein DSO57_1030095 [Entomophthora muscae]|uniref:Uncharacterized protein n=1 Tax=Entomophthora muscae TaxID=34485 RepID=A0ACC2T152_9FUNG|nr:hypothetical protein DSO57_1030095 [Entomophthora muscae]
MKRTVPGGNSKEIPAEEDNGGRQTSEREKHIGKVQQRASRTQPQPLVINPPSGAFLLQTQTGFQSEQESALLFSIGDEGFPIPQLYWGVDIVPQFLYVVMAQNPRTDLKQRITNSGEGFHVVEDKELAGQLGNGLVKLLVMTGDMEGMEQAVQGYLLDHGLQVSLTWFSPLAEFPLLYQSLGVENSNAHKSRICQVARSTWAAIESGAKQQAIWWMALCGDIMLTSDLGWPMVNADDMAAHWEKVQNKLWG